MYNFIRQSKKITIKWFIVYLIFTACIIKTTCSTMRNGFGRNKLYKSRKGDFESFTHKLPTEARRQTQSIKKCDGEENLKQDLAIVSFKLGAISSTAGLFALTEFSVPSNNIGIISTVVSLILWLPSAILTFLATSDPFSYITGNLVNLGSLIITLYGGVSIIFGTLDIIVSGFDEILGIIGLILSAITTFPDMFDELKALFQRIHGKQAVNMFLQNYGCEESQAYLLRNELFNLF